MKALEKDRTRRFDTASSLAADVRRYLNDEPIEARPPSTTYRLTKFTRRHRMPIAVSVAVVLVLLAAVTGTGPAVTFVVVLTLVVGILIAVLALRHARREDAEGQWLLPPPQPSIRSWNERWHSCTINLSKRPCSWPCRAKVPNLMLPAANRSLQVFRLVGWLAEHTRGYRVYA